jgi:hypothetical protein
MISNLATAVRNVARILEDSGERSFRATITAMVLSVDDPELRTIGALPRTRCPHHQVRELGGGREQGAGAVWGARAK